MKSESKQLCTLCDAEADELIEFDGQLLCPDCLVEETYICSHCGDRIWANDNAGSSEVPLCSSCCEYYYTTCASCGCVLHLDNAHYINDGDDPYCRSCYDERRSDTVIHDYFYKPYPIFYGKSKRYFGVELEIDGAGEYDSNALRIIDTANVSDELIYCKHDGSLDEGFEIVTHPMTLDFHLTRMPWSRICETAIEMGYKSHQAMSCGLHIHVNRDSFGETSDEQDEAIARILYFFEKHWEELLRFSRRTQRQLDRWAARYGYKEQPKEILEYAKKGYHGSRYTCVNLCNTDTIEFRIFRGTLKLNTILATLRLVDKICELAMHMTDEDIKHISWSRFVCNIAEPELVRYLKERRLYINDHVEATEEV